MRYGTLCVVDLKRRAFSAEMYALLVNFANLVVQGGHQLRLLLIWVGTGVASAGGGQSLVECSVSHLAIHYVKHRCSDAPILKQRALPTSLHNERRAGARRGCYA